MVEETIWAIRETEKKAEKIVEEAGRESERLLAEAKEKAEQEAQASTDIPDTPSETDDNQEV